MAQRGRPRLIQNVFSPPKSNRQFSEGQKSKGILDDFPVRTHLDVKSIDALGNISGNTLTSAGDTTIGGDVYLNTGGSQFFDSGAGSIGVWYESPDGLAFSGNTGGDIDMVVNGFISGHGLAVSGAVSGSNITNISGTTVQNAADIVGLSGSFQTHRDDATDPHGLELTQTNIISSGTISGAYIKATGDISGAFIEGDGSRLLNLPAGGGGSHWVSGSATISPSNAEVISGSGIIATEMISGSVLRIDNDVARYGITVDAGTVTGCGGIEVDINDSYATRYGLYVHSEATQNNVPLVYVKQDAAGSSVPCMELEHDGHSEALFIDVNGDGNGIRIAGETGVKTGLRVEMQSINDPSIVADSTISGANFTIGENTAGDAPLNSIFLSGTALYFKDSTGALKIVDLS